MSALAATQIPKPADEQAFERCSVILWRCILGDEGVKLHARRGQEQLGVDLFGLRDGNSELVVGVQCKLKGNGKKLTRKEVKNEVREALKFRPSLTEYYIVTTAPDDGDLDRRALRYSICLSKARAKPIKIRVWGWSSLEQEIRKYPRALKAFDPSHTAHGDRIEQTLADLPGAVASQFNPQFVELKAMIEAIGVVRAVDPPTGDDAVQSGLEREINRYRDMVTSDPKTALRLLRELKNDLDTNTAGRIRFRVETNIAACQLELGEAVAAAAGFIAAHPLDPHNPKAVANKALGLLIQADWPALQAFAETELATAPENAALAAYYVQGLVHDETIKAPLAVVPLPVRGTPEVMQAHILWLMDRGEPGEWWAAAIAACAAHPNDPALEEIQANALLDRVLNQKGLLFGRILSASERADVEMAAEFYSSRWRQIRDAVDHVQGKQPSIPLNLIVAYRLLHRIEEAAAVGREALDIFPGDDEVMERVAAAFLEAGDTDRAQGLVSQLEINRETVMMRFHLAMADNNWQEVGNLVTDHLETFPERERELARAALVLADVERAPEEERHFVLEAGRAHIIDDSRALILLAQGARLNGHDALAQDLFTSGIEAFEASDRGFAARAVIAIEAMARGELGVVVDILDGHVDLTHDSAELRLLARGHVFYYPIRQRAVAFFQALSPVVRSLPMFQSLEGMFHVNRGAPQDAIAPFKAAYREQPTMDTLMALIGGHLRVDDRDAIAALIENAGVDDLPGRAIDRINFCQVLLDFGEGTRALELGYTALIDGLERSDVVMKFFGLMIRPTPHRPKVHSGVVATGVWVQLTPTKGAAFESLIGEVADRPWGAKGDPSNTFIAKVLGSKVGDQIEQENAVGQVETWTVTEIKPRWLQAFHQLSQSFSQRFPEAEGFATMTMAEGDIEPTLEQVRRYCEAATERADLYLVQNLPLAFVAGDRPGGTIAFSEYLSTRGKAIKVCLGGVEERRAALKAIRSNQSKGAVLDALTAWRAAELDVFDALESQLGRLAIPATELYQLRSIIDDNGGAEGGELMTLSYEQGQFYRQIISPDERAEQLDMTKRRVAAIEAACDVEPMIVPDALPEGGETLLTFGRGDMVAPILVAGDDRILLCEDMWMRRLGEHFFGLNSVWLQVVLSSAVKAQVMTVEAYSDALVMLSFHRHDYVSISSRELYSVYERDESQTLDRLQILCRFIGTENAEPFSHLALAAEFINKIWSRSTQYDLRAQLATSHVLRALLARNRGDQLDTWASYLSAKLRSGPQAYLSNWRRGHFLI